MSDSDDLPPPLEDMSEQISNTKAMKAKAEGPLFNTAGKSKDHVEEVRLAPKKEEPSQPGVSKIAPSDDFDFEPIKPKPAE